MGGLALLLVVAGGTAVAATRLERNSVRSRHIANKQVRTPDLGKAVVNRAKLAPGAVNSDKVLDESLTATDIDEGTFDGVLSCPAALARAGDLCYETEDRGPGAFSAAHGACGDAGRRLPTTAETVLMLKQLPAPPADKFYRTETPIGSGYANLVGHLASGQITVGSNGLDGASYPYRCVTSPQ